MPGRVDSSVFNGAMEEAARERNVKATAEQNIKDINQEQTDRGGTPAPNSEQAPQGILGPGGQPVSSSGTKAAPVDPWTALTDQLTQQYSSLLNEFAPTASGANQGTMDKTMSGQAEAMLGASASSPMASWLNQVSGAAQAQGSGVTNAMAAETQAAETGAKGIQGALGAMATAEGEQAKYAPYDQLLAALAGEVPYMLSKGTLPSTSPLFKNVPPALQYIEGNVGATQALPTVGGAPGLPAPVAAGTTSANPVPVATTPGTNSPAGG